MFSGIVEALGSVQTITDDGAGGRLLVIREPSIAADLRLGDSIAVNGACLTVTAVNGDAFHFQAGPETLLRTNLGELQSGERVNLERSLRLSDRLGGHLVQGHIDAIGHIAERQRQGDWETVWFTCPAELTTQMVPKGSITVDGVSLTLVDVERSRFSVALIPFTLEHTTLGFKLVGAAVNLETDIIGKYVGKYMLTAGLSSQPGSGR